MNRPDIPLISPQTTPGDGPLTDAEFDRIEAFLEACGPDAMNLEMLDGFLAALISGPDPVPPDEYLPEIWGEQAFTDPDEAGAMTGLVMRHRNTIASALLHTLEHDEIYEAYLYEDGQGRMLGNDWAGGFMHGVQMRADSWQELLQDDDDGSLLASMRWLVHEHDPDPALRPAPITPDARDERVGMMIGALTLIYRHFAPRRRLGSTPRESVRRVRPTNA